MKKALITLVAIVMAGCGHIVIENHDHNGYIVKSANKQDDDDSEYSYFILDNTSQGFTLYSDSVFHVGDTLILTKKR